MFIPGLMEQIRLGNNAGFRLQSYRDDIMEIQVPGGLARNKRIILIIRGIA